MLLALVKITLTDVKFIFIASVYATMILCLIHVCILYVCNGGALLLAIYRMLIGHQSDTHEWLLIYIIYSTTDACAYALIL